MEQQNKLRELTRLQSWVFVLGGLLMVVGMGCYVFMFHRTEAAFVYLTGSVIFSVLQCMQTYSGESFTIKRLKNIMNMADLLFILAGVLMIDTSTHFLRPMFSNQIYYIQYVYNKWLILLLVAVILELYTVHRIAHELGKDSEKGQD